MKKRIVIAIDGYAGSGKSSLAKDLAKRLGFKYIDTGAMYRLLTYHVIKKGMKKKDDIISAAKKLKITMRDLRSKKIRLPEVSNMVSKVSAIKEVRKYMVEHQREMARGGNVIVEGRDIGTVVFPKADVKFFLNADINERAKRRYEELLQKRIKTDEKAVETNLEKRDKKDSKRKTSPLKPARDAIIIDTTNLSIKEKDDLALKYIKRAIG